MLQRTQMLLEWEWNGRCVTTDRDGEELNATLFVFLSRLVHCTLDDDLFNKQDTVGQSDDVRGRRTELE